MNYGDTFQRTIYYHAPYLLKNLIATFYGWNVRRVRSPKALRETVARLKEEQRLPAGRMDAIQFERTKVFLVYAGEHSAYWRDLFSASAFSPQQMTSLSELSRLPILSKNEARTQMDRIVSDERHKLTASWSHTSGTTGHGLRFLEAAECFRRDFAYRVLNVSYSGIAFGDKWAYCAGHPVANPLRKKPPFWVHDYANNWLLLSSYHMSEANLRAYISKLARFKPDLIAGYPSSVYLLALANQSMGMPVRPKCVLTSSETLFENQRIAIEKSFGCKAYSFYACAERCVCATQCEEGKFHLQNGHSYVELLDMDGNPATPDTDARLVCTGFGNYATPLIRYDLGDTARVSDRQTCKCRRNGIILDSILGRSEDYIATPDGRLVGRLDHLFKDSLNVRLAQLEQSSPSSLVIRVEKTSSYGEHDEAEILREARNRLGNEIQITFEYVDHIPRTSNGKIRFILSKISNRRLFGTGIDHAYD